MILEIFVTFVDLFVSLFWVMILGRIILSYFVQPGNRLMGWLLGMTEPLVSQVRRPLPKTPGWDLAPLVTLFLLQGIQYLVDGLIPG